MVSRRLVAALVILIGAATAGALWWDRTRAQVTYGVLADYVPQYDVAVGVGELDQQLVDSHPEGTRFGIAAGVHRLDSEIHPRPGQQFLGEPAAVLNGSRVVADFAAQGQWWVAEGQTQRFDEHGECEGEYTGCGLAEDVFLDDEPLHQVTDLADLAPGSFYFDYDADRIYLADDPAGATVETTVAEAAFVGAGDGDDPADDVEVRNLTIEKFASPAQDGAVDSRDSAGWLVAHNTIRLNHGAGVNTNSRSRVIGNRIVRNGQLGIAGRGNDVLVAGNEIADNNWGGFAHGWEAGGTKWVGTDGLVVRDNWSHDNRGPGLWTDEGNIRTTYEGNLVEGNHSAGIFHEISYTAVIRDNDVRGNGAGHAEWGYGAGIQISASSDVTVTGNTVRDNARGITLIMQDRGDGPHGPREVADVLVEGNTIGPGNGPTGLFSDVGDQSYFTDKNNRFVDNTYDLGDEDTPFEWNDDQLTPEQWRAAGNDTEGTFE